MQERLTCSRADDEAEERGWLGKDLRIGCCVRIDTLKADPCLLILLTRYILQFGGMKFVLINDELSCNHTAGFFKL